MLMIDEIKSEIGKLREDYVGISGDIKHILAGIQEIKNGYVRREEFTPVKSLVYGLVGIIMTGVVVAILALILK